MSKTGMYCKLEDLIQAWENQPYTGDLTKAVYSLAAKQLRAVLDEPLQVEPPQPNRVVVEVRSGMVQGIRAERPDEVVVIVYASTDLLLGFPCPTTFGGRDGEPIGKLNTVSEDPYPECRGCAGKYINCASCEVAERWEEM